MPDVEEEEVDSGRSFCPVATNCLKLVLMFILFFSVYHNQQEYLMNDLQKNWAEATQQVSL